MLALTPREVVRYPHVRCWTDLVHLSNDELAHHDIAAVNLSCAEGLPGGAEIDVRGCLRCLDDWAVGIAALTDRGLETEFRTAPERYEYSEPLFRMATLVLGLQQYCGVTYNPSKIGAALDEPCDLDEQFVHGAVQGPGGTCATLPLVYTAVGRRLGYPVRLVLAKAHCFCRWDDPVTGTRVNIEGTTRNGVNTYPDGHYRAWPYSMSEAEERALGWLASLTPRQELAHFVGRRAHQWLDAGNHRRAVAAQAVVTGLVKEWPGQREHLRALGVLWERELLARRPAGFPKLEITVRESCRRWPWVPWDWERHFRYFEAAEDVLRDAELERRWWAPIRAGQQPLTPIPSMIVVDCTGEEQCTTHP